MDNTAMFILLHDANSLEHIERQYVTFGLIALNVLAFPATGLGGQSHLQANAYGLGYTPVVLSDGQPTPSFVYVPELLTYVTYSFLHPISGALAATCSFCGSSEIMSRMRWGIFASWRSISCAPPAELGSAVSSCPIPARR